jgi:hypothetical protein
MVTMAGELFRRKVMKQTKSVRLLGGCAGVAVTLLWIEIGNGVVQACVGKSVARQEKLQEKFSLLKPPQNPRFLLRVSANLSPAGSAKIAVSYHIVQKLATQVSKGGT